MPIACSSNDNGAEQPPATYSISGRMNGDIRQGVDIAVSGALNATVSTDPDGDYSVSGLPNGSYTITPSKPGYTFTQASRSVVISGADSSGNDFASAAVLYRISGTVSGTVQSGVDITVTGVTEWKSHFTTSITTTGGSFSVSDVPNGDYTIIPVKPGYSFTPATLAVTINASDASNVSFSSASDISVKFNLTGTVSGDIRAGVTITVTGMTSASAVTGPDGTYAVSNLPNGTYTVSASKPGYTFGGDLLAILNGSDSNGNDFTATAVLYSISGTVNGDVTADATITVTGTTEAGAVFGPVATATSGDGSYAVPDVPNGDFTVSATKPGYVFNPVSQVATIAAGNSPNRNFTASVNPLVAFRAGGGTGTNGMGGTGGSFYAESYGTIKVLKAGTVDASFTVPPMISDFGANHYIVSDPDPITPLIEPTTVQLDEDLVNGGLYTTTGETVLYRGNGDDDETNDPVITGLTVNAGSTLVLVDQGDGYGALQLENDLVVHGTITSDLSAGAGLYIEANRINVESTGKISASATTSDASGGEIYLGYGQDLTRTIVNRGTIEAKGDGSGSGGYVYFEPSDLVVNYGTIDVSGGDAGGSGGELDARVDYGDFYSSGTVRMNGGSGTDGGNAGDNYDGYSCWIETGYGDNSRGRNGDIVISGTWEANGGDGTDGNGGNGGYMYFQTDSIGTVTVNASMSAKGGHATGSGSEGGSAGEIYFISSSESADNPTPGKISIAGSYDLRGGNGDNNGGSGGTFYVYGVGVNSSDEGSDTEFVGFPVIVMNGGAGGENGGNASDNAFRLYTYSNSESVPAESITNEADVQARGGDAILEGATGGTGGFVEMIAGPPGDGATVLNNSGSIDVSGGDGDAGGSAYDAGSSDAIRLQAQHVENSGNLTAVGGSGAAAAGGDGGNITLISDNETTPSENTGILSVAGGNGTPPGAEGTAIIDEGGPI